MDTVNYLAAVSMRAKEISIRDTGNCISLAFADNIVLLNKPQISIVEVIKGDTVRIEMGNGATSNIFLKVADVVDPVVVNANALRDSIWEMLGTAASGNGGDGDCACAPLITATNAELKNVIAVVTDGNSKVAANNQVVTAVYDNGVALNQLVVDNHASTLLKLNDVVTEAANVTAGVNTGNNKLDNIMQSVSGTTVNVGATNQILADNHLATLQTLASLKSELINVKTNVSTGNDQLTALNQATSGVYGNGTNGNQFLASLDGKFGNNGFLGNISRKLKSVTVQPPISTVAYAAGQVIGGVMTLTGALRAAVLSGTWMGVQVMEKSIQKAPMDIVIFSQNPTAANFVDHVAPNWSNEYSNIVAITNLVAANYSTLSTSSGACLGNLCKKVISTTGNLYAVAICNGTPTYASASHLYFTFYFEQD